MFGDSYCADEGMVRTYQTLPLQGRMLEGIAQRGSEVALMC
jgi:hypothetical protein